MPDGGWLTLEATNKTLDAVYCAQNPGTVQGQYVQLAVVDNGEGILPERQEHIFEPFFTTKIQGKGTGLGLAMVYGFVKRSGGYIKVYSEPGIGTTFRIYLPRAEGEEQPFEILTEQPETLPQGRETLLLVDDEKEFLEIAQSSLQALGYRVLTASNGPQALERLTEEPVVDLLFSDVVMPGGMNGYELADQAMAVRPGLKVLLTSGYTKKELANTGQGRFTANLLTKPYTQAELAPRVRALLDETGVKNIRVMRISTGSTQAGPAEPPRLIVVDDEPMMGNLVQQVADSLILDTQVLLSGSDLLAQLETRIPDLLVLDLIMPDMDGMEVMRQLAERRIKSAIILMSGYEGKYLDMAAKYGEGKGLNILGTLSKPFPMQVLEKMLREALPAQGI